MAETSYPTLGGGSVVDWTYERLMASVTGAWFTSSPTLGPVMHADATGRQVKVQPHRSAIIFGYRWETDGSGLTRQLDANTSGQPRIDLGVLRLDRSTRSVRFQVKAGAPAATPVAPTLTQQVTENGVWELPCGTVRVTSTTSGQAASNLPSVASSDVAPLDYYGGTQPLVVHSARMPAASGFPGSIALQYDTGRTYRAVGANWELLGEMGALTSAAASSGWTASNVRLQRVNGLCWFQFSATRAGALLNAGTDSVVFTVSAGFRPPADIPMVGMMGATPLRFYLDSSNGNITMTDSGAQVPTGSLICIHPATWPAA